tara:strand:- start:794 stop:1198 length:405 start_codon:yes stop_codon:yes gene_type:complete
MRLAVYGTLRRDYPDKGKIEGFSLVFPGTQSFPAIIKNEKGKGAVVELIDTDDEELNMYDEYENVDGGLYIRTTVNVKMDNGDTEKAWIYVAGPKLWEKSKTFTEVPDGDWHSMKTLIMLDRVYEKKFEETSTI